ncbi:hypothetical protein [Buchnera aphidicola]|uniref:Oxygen-independent coproporphyrinogen-III oxidase-like protein YggW n=1 Tax=Buchnera aphidicola subsp. Tuberolachnus salignus TaxID=98804 RepID=A0A160SZ60_BUCTT|nr:hypothetical protein [Buchnera aphidicola]CUR53341.1 Oxygen-independent coproporphyrinogen-III oxidase-like protein YggW [Buchnera aphidicola (Tuberolachnus salignus)]
MSLFSQSYIKPNISIYINIPKKYFENFSKKKNFKKNIYIESIIQDFKKCSFLLFHRTIYSIFISTKIFFLINPYYLFQILKNLKKFKFKKNIEITLEIFPQKLYLKKIFEYLKLGINRISIKLGTLNKKILKLLNIPTFSQKKIKFLFQKMYNKKININIDLYYGYPEQTLSDILSELKKILIFHPQHITWAPYIPNKKEKKIISQLNLSITFDISKMLFLGCKILKRFGYSQYEKFSYSKKKSQCQHNLNYWNFGDFIGLGCQAHSKITLKKFNILRIIKNKKISLYQSGKYIKKKIYVKKNEIPFEFFLNKFFLLKKISYKNFQIMTHHSIKFIKPILKKAYKLNYLILCKKKIILTKYGQKNLNHLLELFI